MAQQRLSRKRAATRNVSSAPEMNYDALVEAIVQAHNHAQRQAVQAVNLALTLRNWLTGYYIIEYEQQGSDRAKYGERLLETLSRDLRKRLGRGFGWRNLEMFRRFYLRYPISQSVIAKFGLTLPFPPSVKFTPPDWQDDAYFAALFRELPWTHFIELIRLDDPLRRAFYEMEARRNRWSVRELKRQIGSLLFERVGLSRDRDGVLQLARQGELTTSPEEMIRDPYVFEFLGFRREELYTESQLERALLDHLQDFLLELGKGFCLIARQRRVTFDNEHYYIDLLLYNRRLKCLFAIDLINGHFRHEYAGAMNFYLNYLKAEEMEAGENPPVGLILCTDKNETHVEYALGGLSNRVFVSSYLLHLPTEEELEKFLRRARSRLEKQRGAIKDEKADE
ncbi:MAG TPA: PDDEXK nuclease domain-containing protein [Blastocatellia bacterium]|nr:PDDEXK nuclease domain-containing protein [Blastocatellia bacterium]